MPRVDEPTVTPRPPFPLTDSVTGRVTGFETLRLSDARDSEVDGTLVAPTTLLKPDDKLLTKLGPAFVLIGLLCEAESVDRDKDT